MRSKTVVPLTICLIASLLVCVFLYFNWENYFGHHDLPKYPGVKRIGTRLGLPGAAEIAWENENSILFVELAHGEGGSIHRYTLNSGRLEKIFPEFRAFYFQLSPDRKWIAFTGWKDSYMKLWVSELNGKPKSIAEKKLSKYDLAFFGWLYDGQSLIIEYACNQPASCLAVVDKDKQKVNDVYEVDGKELGFTGYHAITPEKIAFVSYSHRNGISIFDISKKEIQYQSFGDSYVFDIEKIPSRNWFVGIINSNDGVAQLYFTPDDFSCIKTPFKELSQIDELDVLETESGIKILLADHFGYLYILDLNAALESEDLDQFFTCDN